VTRRWNLVLQVITAANWAHLSIVFPALRRPFRTSLPTFRRRHRPEVAVRKWPPPRGRLASARQNDNLDPAVPGPPFFRIIQCDRDVLRVTSYHESIGFDAELHFK
jgi:hypothetical protein